MVKAVLACEENVIEKKYSFDKWRRKICIKREVKTTVEVQNWKKYLFEVMGKFSGRKCHFGWTFGHFH